MHFYSSINIGTWFCQTYALKIVYYAYPSVVTSLYMASHLTLLHNIT